MQLNVIMDTLDGVSADVAALYTEKDGKFHLTGIVGVKTQGDVDRVMTNLEKERTEHKATKERYKWAHDLDAEEVQGKLDRFGELETAAAGKLDDDAINDIVNKRVEATINSRVAPLERQVKDLTATNEELTTRADKAEGTIRTTTIHDAVRKEMLDSKAHPTAIEDALLLADRVFEIRADDNAVVTKEGTSFTSGLDPKQFIMEVQEQRSHWWPTSGGGGAGGGGRGQMPGGGTNPWSKDGWNMTKQGQYITEHGEEKAQKLAQAAGSQVGAVRPPEK